MKDETISYEKNYPSLFDSFDLGDRVKRTYKDKKGKYYTYKGIILSINKNALEIYWDTKNERYRPKDMDIAFSHCDLEEIFNGKDNYTPIEKY